MKLDLHSEISKFVTFTLENQIFGVLIHAVEEIITFPEKITPVPKVPHYFSGMINLRGEVISVIDLKRRLDMPSSEQTEKTRILIVSISSVKIGMIVDSVLRVLPISKKEVRPPPAIVHESAAKYIFGSVNQDESVLLLLDTDELIDEKELSMYHHKPAETSDSGALQATQISKERVLIGFKLRNENYAMDINYIEEIIEVPKITKVPEMEAIIAGIFHQRERVLPILHLGHRFRVPPSGETERASVLIVSEGGLVMGYIVDAVTEIFQTFEHQIMPPPANISGRSAEQLEGIVKVNQKDNVEVVMVLHVEKILDEQEHERLLELNEVLNEMTEDSMSEVTDSEMISILKFHVGGEIFAIRVLEIREITVMQKMMQVPKSPPFVNGVINLRGDVITVIDLANVFGNPSESVIELTRIVIVEVDGQKLGFQVDHIIGIEHMRSSLFEKPPSLVQGQYNLFVEGIGREPDKEGIIILMDLHQILRYAEMYDGEWGNLLLAGSEEGRPEDEPLAQENSGETTAFSPSYEN